MKRFAANAEETVDIDKSGNERVIKLALVLTVELEVGERKTSLIPMLFFAVFAAIVVTKACK